MKKIFLLIGYCMIMFDSFAQNVGIGTVTPLTKLHIKGGLLLDSTNGTTPVSGAGKRLMWIPAKAAFRAGSVSGTEWDDINIGDHSTAMGMNTKASGQYAIAIGNNTTASGQASTAMGRNTTASHNYSTAMGYNSIASGEYSTAMGGSAASGSYSTALGQSNANGSYSTAMGYITTASGFYSTTMGGFNTASGDASTAMGVNTTASGSFSTAMGLNTKSKSYGGFTTGLYNDSTNAANPNGINNLNRIFQIGNGTADNARSNAMTVLQNGNVGIGTTTPDALLHVQKGAVLFDSTIGTTPISGPGTRLMWIPAKAAFRAGSVFGTEWDDINIGDHSTAMGMNTKATGQYAIAIGNNTTASGQASTAMGRNTTASHNYSTAMGYNSTASGENSTAMGGSAASGSYSTALGQSNANGSNSTAMGYITTASGFYSTAMGAFNTASGDASTAMSLNTTASGSFSTAMGLNTKSKSYGGFTTGLYNDSTNAANPIGINNLNRIFQIGNGTADNARSNAMTVLQNGNVGIGTVSPIVPLNFASTLGDKIALWTNGTTHYGFGIQNSLFQIYTESAGNDIAFGSGNSSSFNETMRIKGTGEGSIKGNLTVQNGKGLIRNTDGTQSKKLSAPVTVNASFTAGQTQTFAVSWPETFSAGNIEAYVGNVTGGAGGWAEVVMTVTNATTTGATLYVYNPKTSTVTPNFTIKVIAIGPQ